MAGVPLLPIFLKITLKPGEQKQFVFVLGYVELPRKDKFTGKQVINKAPAKSNHCQI